MYASELIQCLENCTPEELAKIGCLIKRTEAQFAYPTKTVIAGDTLAAHQGVWIGLDGKAKSVPTITGHNRSGFAIRDIIEGELVPFNPATGELG